MRNLIFLILFALVFNCGKVLDSNASNQSESGSNVVIYTGPIESDWVEIKGINSSLEWLGVVYVKGKNNPIDTNWMTTTVSAFLTDSSFRFQGPGCDLAGSTNQYGSPWQDCFSHYRIPFIRK